MDEGGSPDFVPSSFFSPPTPGKSTAIAPMIAVFGAGEVPGVFDAADSVALQFKLGHHIIVVLRFLGDKLLSPPVG